MRPIEHTPMHQSQAAIDRSDYLSRQNVVLKKVAMLLMERLELMGCKFSAIDLDHANEAGLTIRVDEEGVATLLINELGI